MDFSLKRAAAASILLLSSATLALDPAPGTIQARRAIMDWPEYSRDLAAVMILKHGAPDGIEASRLTWTGQRPWTRMVVFRDALDRSRLNGLLQAVRYDVPPRRWRALGAFDRGVSYDPVQRELVVRGDDEGTNDLALNLADEVIKGLRTAQEARAFYDKTLSLSFSGKSSKYMRRLRFRPRSI